MKCSFKPKRISHEYAERTGAYKPVIIRVYPTDTDSEGKKAHPTITTPTAYSVMVVDLPDDFTMEAFVVLAAFLEDEDIQNDDHYDYEFVNQHGEVFYRASYWDSPSQDTFDIFYVMTSRTKRIGPIEE